MGRACCGMDRQTHRQGGRKVTTTNTQRVAALRQRRKAAGLVRVEYYLTPDAAKKVKEFINQLKAQA